MYPHYCKPSLFPAKKSSFEFACVLECGSKRSAMPLSNLKYEMSNYHVRVSTSSMPSTLAFIRVCPCPSVVKLRNPAEKQQKSLAILLKMQHNQPQGTGGS
jgi:hypothetical protein